MSFTERVTPLYTANEADQHTNFSLFVFMVSLAPACFVTLPQALGDSV